MGHEVKTGPHSVPALIFLAEWEQSVCKSSCPQTTAVIIELNLSMIQILVLICTSDEKFWPVRYEHTGGIISFRYEPGTDSDDVYRRSELDNLREKLFCLPLHDSEESMKLIARRLKIKCTNPSSSSAMLEDPQGMCVKRKCCWIHAELLLNYSVMLNLSSQILQI